MSDKPLSFSFPPIITTSCQILILGSMPGVASLKQQQYYAHPRNAFWPIMSAICEFDIHLDYADRCKKLLENNIAVWDVLKACHRPGSLDQRIDTSTIEANNFIELFEYAPNIEHVFFNGVKSEQLFKQHVLPSLVDSVQKAKLIKLPSTSPAHAAVNFETKKSIWSQAIKFI